MHIFQIVSKEKEKNYINKSGYEMQYRDIKPMIFTEEYIKNTN